LPMTVRNSTNSDENVFGFNADTHITHRDAPLAFNPPFIYH